MGLGKECGALTGGFMVIGLSVQGEKDERDARFKSYCLVKEFIRRFEAKPRSIVCKDLIGLDLGTSAGRERATQENLFQTLCPDFVKTASEILCDMAIRPRVG
jgi:C_GCAxxG_C_C family probable redox protein